MNKLFKNLKDKFDSFYSNEGTDLDKDIFINSDQRLLKIASSIIVTTSFLGIGWLAIAKTDEIIIVPGKIIPIGKVKEIKMPMSGVIENIEIKEGDLVDKNQVLMRIESDTNSNLSTTLENSINIPSKWFLEGRGLRFNNLNLFKKIYHFSEIDTDKNLIFFCYSGLESSINWFVSYELMKNKNSKLYEGSLFDWVIQNKPLYKKL